MKQHITSVLFLIVFMQSCEISRSEWEARKRVTASTVGGKVSDFPSRAGSNIRLDDSGEEQKRNRDSAKVVEPQVSTVSEWLETQPKFKPTGNNRVELQVAPLPRVGIGSVMIDGRATWEQEVQPWYVYKYVTRREDQIVDTQLVVDPPTQMGEVPNHSSNLTSSSIPSQLRKSVALEWHYVALDRIGEVYVEWVFDTIPEVGKELSPSGRQKLTGDGTFAIKIDGSSLDRLAKLNQKSFGMTIYVTGGATKKHQYVTLDRSAFQAALPQGVGSPTFEMVLEKARSRPSTAKKLPSGYPKSREWDPKIESLEIPTGKRKATPVIESEGSAQGKKLVYSGQVKFEQEWAPYHIYKVTESYLVNGKMATYERKVVDPVEFRGLIPDFDPFMGPKDIFELNRRSITCLWREYEPTEQGASYVSWRFSKSVIELLNPGQKGLLGRSMVYVKTRKFEVEFSEDLVEQVATLPIQTVDVYIKYDDLNSEEILVQLKKQDFIDAAFGN